MGYYTRRDFIKTSLIGGAAVTLSNPVKGITSVPEQEKTGSFVSVSSGDDRADMVFRALQPFAAEIRKAIGNRRVVLKPNNVLIYVPLACTHVETLEGILEFLKSIGKLRNTIIAESSASGSTLEGFDNYGYNRLLPNYPVKLIDLDNGPFEKMYVIDERDFEPRKVRVSSVILDPNSYIVSVARMKTHNTVGATLSLKNIVFGSPIKDSGFTLYNEDIRFSEKASKSRPGAVSYKRLLHGSGFHAVNYNMALLAQKLHPDLAVIDGHTGMEHNGPTLGTPIDHRVCVASQDWLAADRVGIELMGMDFSKIGYLNHCYNMGLGNADLNKIEIVGENIKYHIKQYRLPDNFEKQGVWMNPKS
ncbi:MAG: DUF362 domain-containing protein [Candidatus Atribacteria bacterium]|nr:MAG: DUF362 domain-containing protein [Candidatus Atribacteria bacterium]